MRVMNQLNLEIRLLKCLKKNNKKKNHFHFIEYKRMQANVRRIIKYTKKDCWRKFCNTVGRETEYGE